MVDFTRYDETDAPEASRPALEQAKKEMGGDIANLYRYMAESPQLLDAYRHLRSVLMQTSMSQVEQEVVNLTINFEHDCGYCMAGHSMRAKMLGMDAAVLEALRSGTPLPDDKLQALRCFTVAMVQKRGWAEEAELEAFLAAGFDRQNILEVVLAIGTKVMTNYSNHLFSTPLNDFLKPFEWTRPEAG